MLYMLWLQIVKRLATDDRRSVDWFWKAPMHSCREGPRCVYVCERVYMCVCERESVRECMCVYVCVWFARCAHAHSLTHPPSFSHSHTVLASLRGPYNSTILHSYTNVPARKEVLTPGTCHVSALSHARTFTSLPAAIWPSALRHASSALPLHRSPSPCIALRWRWVSSTLATWPQRCSSGHRR
jgi:hypothetical protein